MEVKMPEEVLNQIREFEIRIKKIIENKYGKNISPEKLAILDSKNYSDMVDLSDGIDTNKIESEIVRDMFNDCVDITSEKVLDVDGTMREIPYAGNLQKGLVEYYTQELAREYNLKLETIPELQYDVNMIIFIKQVLGESFDEVMYKENAATFLNNNIAFQDLIKHCDRMAIEEYVKLIAKMQTTIPQTDEDNIHKYIQKINDEPDQTQEHTNEYNQQLSTSFDYSNYNLDDLADLWRRFMNNDTTLAAEDYKILRDLPPEVIQVIQEIVAQDIKKAGFVPTLYNNQYHGFTSNTLTLYILSVLILLGMLIGYVLFKCSVH
jgi:hypothetical protein